MRRHLKKYFIPHAENDYHPHILHTKRAVLYSALLLASKALVVGLVLALPLPAFVTPDVLDAQKEKLFRLTNDLRVQAGVEPLFEHSKLGRSSDLKATDMAEHEYFSHVGPRNHTLQYFLSQANYSYQVAGENLAMGFSEADEVFAAWLKSPTHYHNLIDSDFTESGIALAGGMYKSAPTVYVANHFARPKLAPAAPSVAPRETATATAPVKAIIPTSTVSNSAPVINVLSSAQVVDDSASPEMVLGSVASAASSKPMASPTLLDHSTSFVSWGEHEAGILLTPALFVKGQVRDIHVEVEKEVIALYRGEVRADGFTAYSGQMVLPITPSRLFRVIVPPVAVITNAQGEQIAETVAWENPLVLSPTPVQKYVFAKNNLSFLGILFNVSRSIYLVALVIFSVALALSIGIEVRKQHPHIIVQTLGLIAMIGALIIS